MAPGHIGHLQPVCDILSIGISASPRPSRIPACRSWRCSAINRSIRLFRIKTSGSDKKNPVLFVKELATRRVYFGGCTPNPDAAWMNQIAKNLTDCLGPDYSRKVTVILSAAKNLLMCDESRSFAALRMTGMVLLGEVNDSVLRTTSCIKTRPVDE